MRGSNLPCLLPDGHRTLPSRRMSPARTMLPTPLPPLGHAPCDRSAVGSARRHEWQRRRRDRGLHGAAPQVAGTVPMAARTADPSICNCTQNLWR